MQYRGWMSWGVKTIDLPPWNLLPENMCESIPCCLCMEYMSTGVFYSLGFCLDTRNSCQVMGVYLCLSCITEGCGGLGFMGCFSLCQLCVCSGMEDEWISVSPDTNHTATSLLSRMSPSFYLPSFSYLPTAIWNSPQTNFIDLFL